MRNESDPSALRSILRNPATTSEILASIAGDRRLVSSHEVRLLLVDHPHTPTRVSRRLVQDLYWKQLADLCRSRRAPILVRRDAERYLTQRQKSMALGERVSVARIATRGVIPALLQCGTVEVLTSLLDNSLLREDEVMQLASSPQTPPQVLGHLSRHSRWNSLGSIQAALLRNHALPVADALRLVSRAAVGDLQRIGNDVNVPRIVRVAADRRQST